MQKKRCTRHGVEYPCSCGMGNLYRFVEPVVLHMLQTKGRSCGYELCAELQDHALTDAEIDKAALYRTLRQLEKNGKVKSTWETGDGGPARRVYRLTRAGAKHLDEWTVVLANLAKSMTRFVSDVRRERQPAARRAKAA